MRVLFLFFCLPFFGFSQTVPKKDQIKAKRITANASTLLNEGQSTNAYMLLKQAVALDSTNANAYFLLATTEFDLRSYYYAQEHSQKALSLLGTSTKEEQLYLAIQIELALGILQKATDYLEQAKTLLDSQKKFKVLGFELLQQQCQFALNEQQKGHLNQRQLLGSALNTKYDEYAPILSHNRQDLYFTSRNPNTKGANLNPDDQRYFEDIYQYQQDGSNYGAWTRVLTNDDLLNTEGFDALSYVSTDQLSALGTLNTTASKELNTQGSDIFELFATSPGIWDDKSIIAEIPRLNSSYFEGSPTKTDTIWIDEFTYIEELYFVSDRQAEKFSTDIYMTKKINGVWQAAVQALPQGINTEGRETTPFVSPDGKLLFFASDGHPGMGGFDIFYCTRENEGWSAPKNLGAFVNTTLDDTHFQLSGQTLTWASVSDLEGLFSYNMFEAPIGILTALELK